MPYFPRYMRNFDKQQKNTLLGFATQLEKSDEMGSRV